MLNFYGFNTTKDQFFLYQGRQRAPEIMANMIINGGSKYNRSKRSNKKKRKKERKKERKKGKGIKKKRSGDTTIAALNQDYTK